MSQSERDEARRITDLPRLIAALPDHERAVVERLFAVEAAEGVIAPPAEMEPWLAATFGSVEAALRQRVIRVMNRWTFEGAAFNLLRARRPISNAGAAPGVNVRQRIENTRGDDFCDPERRTPAEVFGRVRVGRVSAASNVAKADGWHAVLIFDEHDPLAVDAQGVTDLLATAEAWAARVRERDPFGATSVPGLELSLARGRVAGPCACASDLERRDGAGARRGLARSGGALPARDGRRLLR